MFQMTPVLLLKLALVLTLALAIALSAVAGAPRRAAPLVELRSLVASAVSLYGVGTLAFFTHHRTLAGFVLACGVAVSALAAWLSRGADSSGPPSGPEPVGGPPSDPGDGPALDWSDFDRAFRAYAERPRQPV